MKEVFIMDITIIIKKKKKKKKSPIELLFNIGNPRCHSISMLKNKWKYFISMETKFILVWVSLLNNAIFVFLIKV